jgi:peptide/nickel transport system permease protein
MGLKKYALIRFLETIPTLIIIIIINFLIIHLAPGDPAAVFTMGGGLFGGPDRDKLIMEVRMKFGLDRPIQEQLIAYIVNVLKGDLGYSFFKGKPVTMLIMQTVPATLLLILTSELLAILIGTLLGAYSASKMGSKIDVGLFFASSVLYSMPIFWLGLMLILAFSFNLSLFPTSGMVTVTGAGTGMAYLLDVLWHLFLPALALCLTILPVFLRITRASVMEIMREDFIVTARAVGLKERTIFFRHALRNALIPVVTTAALFLGFVLSGTVLIETVFGWPGMGRLMFDALTQRDYPLLLGIFVFTSICVVYVTLITDIIYAYLDPRVVYK